MLVLKRLHASVGFIHGRLVLVQLLLADSGAAGTGNHLVGRWSREFELGLIQVELALGPDRTWAW